MRSVNQSSRGRNMRSRQRGKKKWVPIVVKESVKEPETEPPTTTTVEKPLHNTVNPQNPFLWELFLKNTQENRNFMRDKCFTFSKKRPTEAMYISFISTLLHRCIGHGDTETLSSRNALMQCWNLHHHTLWLRAELKQKSNRKSLPYDAETEEINLYCSETLANSSLFILEAMKSQMKTFLPGAMTCSIVPESKAAARKPRRLRRKKAEEICVDTNVKTEVKGIRAIEQPMILPAHMFCDFLQLTTEAMQCRITWEDRELLVNWMSDLTSCESRLNVWDAMTKVNTKTKKKDSTRHKTTFSTIAAACGRSRKQLEEFLAFLEVNHKKSGIRLQRPQDTLSAEAERAALDVEISSLHECLHITQEEEQERIGVSKRIQSMIQDHETDDIVSVHVYGSSCSGTGSKTSDIDLCFVKSPAQAELQAHSESPSAYASIEKEQLAHANFCTLLDELSYAADQKLIKMKEWEADSAQVRDQSMLTLDSFFRPHLIRFSTFLHALHEATVSQSKNGAVVSQDERERKDRVASLFRLRDLLQSHGFEIKQTVHRARVPVLRFVDPQTKFACDFSFGNSFAIWNTLLLRCYASLDSRLAVVAYAIKYWAKQRHINDASIGFLSSYSYVIMVIYYFLERTKLVPNLQDPRLVQIADIERFECAPAFPHFCYEVDTAQKFHAQVESEENYFRVFNSEYPKNCKSLQELLIGFFDFYVNDFDFASQVISIRLSARQKRATMKVQRWGARTAKIWRMSLEDPLELDRDLGSVLKQAGQNSIISELERAYKLLLSGKSFLDCVCAPDNSNGGA